MVLSLRYLKGKYCTLAKYFSQTTKAAMNTTPRTIMAIMYPVFQPLGALGAKLKGSKSRQKPKVVQAMPTTEER